MSKTRLEKLLWAVNFAIELVVLPLAIVVMATLIVLGAA